MERAIIAEIERWNAMEAVRKPLVLMGARQVGKSWLMKTFAEAHYPQDNIFVDLHDDWALCEAIEDSHSDALGYGQWRNLLRSFCGLYLSVGGLFHGYFNCG